ncbi:MAG: hypothetical protein ED558_02705 [Oricola sp.]|nr:MAG: hypothetical protein ED558_02705 [Oricola sp.]
MTITSEGAVLVVGAGTSVQFGLSLGGDMITSIAGAIESELSTIRLLTEDRFGVFSSILSDAVNRSEGFKRLPIHGTVGQPFWDTEKSRFEGKAINEELNKLRELQQLLTNQTSETIDDFIVENPSYAQLSKQCIAAQFVQSCCEIDRNVSARSFEARKTVDGGRNWVHLLINIVRQGIRAGEVSTENKVKIVTFNYDMVLEYVLEQQFSNTERRSAHWSDYIEIVHVHGQCGSLSELQGHPAKICNEWAAGIHVVNEQDVPEPVLESRARARELVRSATELYFCGFAFSGPNCRLLNLHQPLAEVEERTISFCNYDGNVGVTKIVSSYETEVAVPELHEDGRTTVFRSTTTYIEEAAGTPDKPLGVSDWLKLGYLGELPA